MLNKVVCAFTLVFIALIALNFGIALLWYAFPAVKTLPYSVAVSSISAGFLVSLAVDSPFRR
jgi:hypothetical protein